MKDITRIGMDTSKSVFQLHRVNGAEDVVRPGFRRDDGVIGAKFTQIPRRAGHLPR